MPKGTKKGGNGARKKGFKIDETHFLELYILCAKDSKCILWTDFHARCVEMWGYRPEQDGHGEMVFEDSANTIPVMTNHENEGAQLTMASLKARLTRLNKKMQEHYDAAKTDKKDRLVLTPFENPAKAVKVKKEVIWDEIIEKMKKAGVGSQK